MSFKHNESTLVDPLKLQMVQMGRIMKAKALHQDRADLIAMNATKKMAEAQEAFHNILDEMEMEIVSCDL